MISLSVPGTLEYRDVAVRVVGAACKLYKTSLGGPGDPHEQRSANDLSDEEVSQVVSAFGEAFNNLALHGYKGLPPGRVSLTVQPLAPSEGLPGGVEITLEDTGHVFDPAGHLELPEALPERGMGLFIMRSFLDEIRYVGGPPNRLILVKRFTV